ncbi:unnamed protein product, partial [marine sediment metagenome]
MLPIRNALALSPHTDDAELGCGGFLTRLKEEGIGIFIVNFSRSIGPDEDKGHRVVKEFEASM